MSHPVPGSPVERRAHLLGLTALRAFAAVFVFLSHLDVSGGTVGPARAVLFHGYLGVGFFFVLSGFVLAWSFRPGTRLGDFYLRRFARIYPSHLVMLALSAVLPVIISSVDLRALLSSAALVQTWSPDHLDPYGGNGVAWSLSCEIAFYATLPFLLPLLLRCTPRVRWALALAWWGASAAVTALVAFRVGHYVDAVYVFPPVRFGEFLLGVVAAVEVQRGWRLSGRGALALTAVGMLLVLPGLPRFPATVGGAGLVCLALVVWAAQRDLGGHRSWLTSRPLVYLGEVSFAFYLAHELVLINVSPLIGLSGWTANLVLVPASCLAAWLLHTCVERPCEARLRGLRRTPVRPAAAEPVPRPRLSDELGAAPAPERA